MRKKLISKRTGNRIEFWYAAKADWMVLVYPDGTGDCYYPQYDVWLPVAPGARYHLIYTTLIFKGYKKVGIL